MEPFVMYAKCAVVYVGRAYSTLDLGNYLIIYKNDGTLLIHAGIDAPPRNYQTAGSQLTRGVDKLIVTNKKETITITIETEYFCQPLAAWSTDKVKISRTEKELVQQLCANLGTYLGECLTIQQEHQTELGNIDILAHTSDGQVHLIEVKRKSATLAAVSQLARYAGLFPGCKAYLAAPAISKRARQHLEAQGGTWWQVDHQTY